MSTKAKIEVLDSPISCNIVKSFKTIEELLVYNESANLNADQIVVNDCVLMGWDELYMFV